ncbi:ead/Ea22-like family protein [Salmonella enterica subsp. enterica serovar Cerro]|uniref:Ead/Ea22-like family protein n=1 Tax=Salmonella enterica subsp. enterica serovar Cerro TaxID=340188 RepID=A0A730IFH6_SALET|nr:ead/Ea22-like family protein [Salmonella enterica subsp. enterica serovar Cerro]EKR1616401.1 ead/Ea22-like family protein [Salmonella enterica subsp. enterica serovar Cerro]MBJ3222157.1 ead/Ea22-like family protein [Salmonella enterica subsp. enterica serovar Bovismorbificans]MBJ5896417.1 ead/Ea22-like family protein [Salmonella enterica subsp. enterica serovar Bredeney]HAE3753165.1 ead/Ea22-like family protein [Salmonella enterica subsp. enterica serovar Cerro]
MNIDKQELREEFQYMQDHYSDPADRDRQIIYIAAEALLDELEKAQRANVAQDDHINQQQDRIEQLEKGHKEAAKQINSWRRLAKQNIAERGKDISELEAARQRIAELEARTVNLSKRSVGEVMHMSGFSRDYAEGWCAGNDNAIHEIRTAGIKVKES